MITPILSLLLAVPIVSPVERPSPVVVSREATAHVVIRSSFSIPPVVADTAKADTTK